MKNFKTKNIILATITILLISSIAGCIENTIGAMVYYESSNWETSNGDYLDNGFWTEYYGNSYLVEGDNTIYCTVYDVDLNHTFAVTLGYNTINPQGTSDSDDFSGTILLGSIVPRLAVTDELSFYTPIFYTAYDLHLYMTNAGGHTFNYIIYINGVYFTQTIGTTETSFTYQLNGSHGYASSAGYVTTSNITPDASDYSVLFVEMAGSTSNIYRTDLFLPYASVSFDFMYNNYTDYYVLPIMQFTGLYGELCRAGIASNGGANQGVFLEYNSTSGTTTQLYNYTTTLQINTWYTMTVNYNLGSAGVGFCQLYIDGVLCESVYVDNSGLERTRAVTIGCIGAISYSKLLYMDNVQISDENLATITPQTAIPKTLQFSGYTWDIKNAIVFGPGPCTWSGQNAYVDNDGYLHMKISYNNGLWYCSEVITQQWMTYGTYTYTLQSAYGIELSEVLGLFSYADDNNEIDWEVSQWLNLTRDNSQATVQPEPYYLSADGVTGGNQARFNLTYTGQVTFAYTWTATGVNFLAWMGNSSTLSQYTLLMNYTSSFNMQKNTFAPVHINWWLVNNTDPISETGKEIVVESFTYKPASGVFDGSTTINGTNYYISGYISNPLDGGIYEVNSTNPLTYSCVYNSNDNAKIYWTEYNIGTNTIVYNAYENNNFNVTSKAVGVYNLTITAISDHLLVASDTIIYTVRNSTTYINIPGDTGNGDGGGTGENGTSTGNSTITIGNDTYTISAYIISPLTNTNYTDISTTNPLYYTAIIFTNDSRVTVKMFCYSITSGSWFYNADTDGVTNINIANGTYQTRYNSIATSQTAGLYRLQFTIEGLHGEYVTSSYIIFRVVSSATAIPTDDQFNIGDTNISAGLMYGLILAIVLIIVFLVFYLTRRKRR